MKRICINLNVVAAWVVGMFLIGLEGTGADAREPVTAPTGVEGALSWAAKVEVLDLSGRIVRNVNGTLLREGVVVQTSALNGAAGVRVRTRDGQSRETAIVLNAHPGIGLSLLQLPERPSQPAVLPQDGSYRAKMRVWLLNGPGIGPDSLSARIYQNFQVRDFPDLCPINRGVIGAAPAVDSTGRFLGVACDLSNELYKCGYIVPAGSVGLLTAYQAPTRSVAGLSDLNRPGFEDDRAASGLLFRGAVLAQIGQLDDARRVLHLAEEKDASLTEIYYWIGRALLAQEQYRQAAEEFQYVAGKDSSNYLAWHMAGAALHQAGDFPGAEKMYLKAIQIKPDAADSYCNLGGAYLSMKRGSEAEKAWRTSIRINPRSQDGLAYYNLASTLQHGGRTAALDSIYAEIAKVEPSWEQRLREALEKKHH